MTESSCDRCGKVYNRYLGDRFWFGDFQWTEPDGTKDSGETLCDDCHRAVIWG